MLRLSRERRTSGGAERTLLLISQYREHEKLFRNVHCKKKSVWELLTAEGPNFSAQTEQLEGKWKSLTLAFHKCCDHNSISGSDRKECPLYRAHFTGLMFARMRQAAALGRRKRKETEEEERNEEEVTVVLKRPATSQGSQGSLQKKKRLSKKEKGVKSGNEYLHWLQEYKEEKKNREEKKMDLVTSLSLRFLLLKLQSDKKIR